MKHVGLGRDRHIQLLSGRAHPELAKQISEHLKIKLTPVHLNNFSNGEISCRIGETLRGNDVFIIQTHAGNIHEALMEQLLMIDTAKRASARSITAVCPLLCYARQDRKSAVREPIGARLVIDMLSAAGANRIMSIDLHSGQTQGFFNGPFDHLIAMSLFKKYIREHFGSDLVMVSPDAGRVKLTERYSSALGCDIAIIHKHRTDVHKGTTDARHLIGEVKGRICVLVDDMIDTAGTICAAADLLKQKGAKAVYGISTHGILSGPALERIEASGFEKIIVTDTVPPPTSLKAGKSSKIEVLSVAPMIADAIAAVSAGRSVSALFEGQNQM